MALKVIAPPVSEPLTLDWVKQQLGIDSDLAFDYVLNNYIKQAREYCEDYQNKKYITQTLELILDEWPEGAIEFTDCSPLQSVVSLSYTKSDGTTVTEALSNYLVDADSFVGRLVPKLGSWPSEQLQAINAVRVRFIAGYTDVSLVPESIKSAMMLHIKLLHDDYRPDERLRFETARNNLLGLRRKVPV